MPNLEPVSGQVGLRFLGKVISGCRDRTAITSARQSAKNPETKSTGREGANTWVFGAAPGNLRRASNHGSARLGMRDLRGEIATAQIVQLLSRPGTVGFYLGTQRVHKGGRDRTAITPVETECEDPETKSTGREGANTWVFGAAPGNLRRAAIAMRTRTKDPLDWRTNGGRGCRIQWL
jgi:hypothetical protein